ncbi:MAG: ATPase [Deltaproteobacteria bacterium]|nr:ATPase [Deltaproteobacteria bacterium]
MTDPLFAGVDVGAAAAKAVLVNAGGEIVGKSVCPSGMDFDVASKAVFDSALSEAGAPNKAVVHVVASGYGRKNVTFASSTKTEIACHSKGVYRFFPEALSIVDIGGQDNKIIKIGADGARLDFKMNRKCAAGTGAFLEEIARRMDVAMEDMEELAKKSTETVEIGSFCTVFSATEILALIRKGAKVPDIAKGAFRSVIKRITEMDPLGGKVVATGGVVAHNPVVVKLLSETVGSKVETPPHPQFAGALGAALYALEE